MAKKNKLKEVIADLEIARYQSAKEAQEAWQYYDELRDAICEFLGDNVYMPHEKLCYILKNGKALKYRTPLDDHGHVMIVENEVEYAG